MTITSTTDRWVSVRAQRREAAMRRGAGKGVEETGQPLADQDDALTRATKDVIECIPSESLAAYLALVGLISAVGGQWL